MLQKLAEIHIRACKVCHRQCCCGLVESNTLSQSSQYPWLWRNQNPRLHPVLGCTRIRWGSRVEGFSESGVARIQTDAVGGFYVADSCGLNKGFGSIQQGAKKYSGVKSTSAMGSVDVSHSTVRLHGSDSIDHLEYRDVTPIIGREYPHAKLKDMLNAPNAEQQLRDLAITICERGVAFFLAPQDDLSVEEQKYITELLGSLTSRPKDHGLHVFPLANDPNMIPMEDGTKDPRV